MGDDDANIMSLLTGGMDARTMVKDFIKKYKNLILLIILLVVLGGWAGMASKGYSLTSIAYTFLGAAIVAIFLLNMIVKWMKGPTVQSGDMSNAPDDVLIKRRVKKQREIDELDVVLDERVGKLRSDAKKITQAKKDRMPKQPKKRQSPESPKESTGDGHEV